MDDNQRLASLKKRSTLPGGLFAGLRMVYTHWLLTLVPDAASNIEGRPSLLTYHKPRLSANLIQSFLPTP
jgi:hypothetical protein